MVTREQQLELLVQRIAAQREAALNRVAELEVIIHQLQQEAKKPEND